MIDLGFNSLKLVSYYVDTDGAVSLYDQRSFPARLGEGLSKTGSLGEEQTKRTITMLKMCAEIIDLDSIKQVLPVATSAVREASNRDQFLRRVQQDTGFRFRVLSAHEEAYYSYFGASRCMTKPDVFFFDIGGGSLELVHTLNYKIKKVFSLPLGALRLTQLYANDSGSFSKKNYSKLKKRVLDLLPDRDEFGMTTNTILMGVGGSLRAIANYDQELTSYPLHKIHGYTVKKENMDSIANKLVKSDLVTISKIDSIGGDRAKTITAGAIVMDLIMEKMGFDEMTVSTRGLRDGILSAYLNDPRAFRQNTSVGAKPIPPPTQVELLYSGRAIAELVSKKLVDKTEAEILSSATRMVLKGLPRLGPIPIFYTLVDEEMDLDHREQLLMALAIVRRRRPKISELLFDQYKSILKPASKNLVKKLSALLGLMTLFERTRSRVKISFGHEAMKIELSSSKASQDFFPVETTKLAVEEVGEVLNVRVKFSLRQDHSVRAYSSREVEA